MKIIEFPGVKTMTPTKERELQVERIDIGIHTPLHGPWQFTCVECGHKTGFDTSKMFFKSLEFYCVECGSLYKVTNPVFKNKPKKIPEPKQIRIKI